MDDETIAHKITRLLGTDDWHIVWRGDNEMSPGSLTALETYVEMHPPVDSGPPLIGD